MINKNTVGSCAMLYRDNGIYKFRYDYSKCMMMKLPMAYPEPKDTSKSHVIMNFEQALDYIKEIDNMTPGITKIYYLVGWQYNGHDDKYPDFFEVNSALGRKQDASARDSLIWLHEEAKKYSSVVSLHINFNDAYRDAPSFGEFVKRGALIRRRNGKPRAIERYNGKRCYKTCFKGYWESGLFKRNVDRLIELLPFLPECGTVHVDNFQCYHNYAPSVSISEMQDYRRKMIDYVHGKGIDITSEFTYKETESLPNRKIFGLPREHHWNAPMDTVGLIPASWWCTRMNRRELVEVPPQLYSGGIYKDKRYSKYLYGNIHGEDIIKPDIDNREQKFMLQFATVQVPYHFLCTHKRLGIYGHGANERCEFSDGIISYCKDSTITQNGEVLKKNGTVFLPYIHRENCCFAYSETGETLNTKVPFPGNIAKIYALTPSGMIPKTRVKLNGGKLRLETVPGEALIIDIE